MAHQAPVNRMRDYFSESSGRAAPEATLRGARRISADLFELGELQARLLLADTKAASRRLVWFAILLVIGAVVLLSAMPVAVEALGRYLATAFRWPLAGGLALAAGIAALIGAILLGVASAVVRAGIAKFNRSANELRENLAMIKEMVAGSPDHPKQDL